MYTVCVIFGLYIDIHSVLCPGFASQLKTFASWLPGARLFGSFLGCFVAIELVEGGFPVVRDLVNHLSSRA